MDEYEGFMRGESANTIGLISDVAHWKSFDEMLRSLDVKSTGNTRQGRTDKDRDQQDTTGRQSAVPKQLEEKFRMYQRSMSGQKDPKSKK